MKFLFGLLLVGLLSLAVIFIIASATAPGVELLISRGI